MIRSSSALSAAGRARGPLALLVVGAVAISFAGILARLSETGPAATGFFRFLLARGRSRESEPVPAGAANTAT